MADINDVFEIMSTTRSMRRLKPDPVPDELIEKILHAGLGAANGGNFQKWRFMVIKDPAKKKAVQEWYKKAFDEVVGPRYASSAPPPGATADKYKRQHGAVEYLTEHYHEAPGLDRCLSGRRSEHAGPLRRRVSVSRRAEHVAGDPRAGPRLDIDDAASAVRKGD